MRIARLPRIPRAAPTASWLALLLSLAGPAAPAAAQTVQVSNLGANSDTHQFLANDDVAQGFTAGSHLNGYDLHSVQVCFSGAPTGVSVKLMTGVSATSAGTEVATLTNPATLAVGNLTFSAPTLAGVPLAAGRQYWLVVEGTTGKPVPHEL